MENDWNSAEQRESLRTSRAAVSRRKFVTAAVAGAGALATSGRGGWAQSSDTIRIGFITPRSGALAAFGEPDAFVLETARKILADGLSAGGKSYKIEILDRDVDRCRTIGQQVELYGVVQAQSHDGCDFARHPEMAP